MSYKEIGVPDHQNIQRWHGCFGRGDNNVIRPSSRHERFESLHSPIQEENPEMFLSHARSQLVLWVLDSIFQTVKGAQEAKMGLEIRYVDQRGDFMLTDGEGGGELGRILGVGRWRLLASFRTCRGRGWETDLARGGHGMGLDAGTSRWQRPFIVSWAPAREEENAGLRRQKRRPSRRLEEWYALA